MSRQARKKSSTGVYHIMLRGIDKRDLFLDDEDRKKFKDIFVKAIDEGRFDLYGYCLMGNHVHLLLKAMEDPGIIMKRITVS
ncbi:MAG: transposase, partial [Bacillota bacterium]